MTLRFVLGRAGSGKSILCLEEIRSGLREDPQGTPLILLVPEQSTYQKELALAATPALGGILRAEVLSFRRLGWRVLSETGGGRGVVMGELGKRMLLSRILLLKRAELKFLANSALRPGMVDLLVRIIGEFKTYRLTPEELHEVVSTGLSRKLEEKLTDLAFLYSEFQAALGEGLRDPDDELSLLAEKIPSSPTIGVAKVWVDGFKGFTPQELHVLEEILAICPEVTITLPLDPELLYRAAQNRQVIQPGEERYFTAWQTYQVLQRLALVRGVPVVEPVLLAKAMRFTNPWLRHLEEHFFTYPAPAFPKELDDTGVSVEEVIKPGVHWVAAVNRRAEVDGVARELRRLAREEGFRWQEMAILSRDLSIYAQLILDAFKAHEVPVFLDYKRAVMHHPLLEFLLSVMEIVQSNWAFEPVFRCLKTDFFPLGRDEVDRLENYCLAHGIQGQAWLKKEDWTFVRRWTLQENETLGETEIQREINLARRTVTEILTPFVEKLTSVQALPVRFVTGELFDLLEKIDIPGQLVRWATMAEADGKLDDARLQKQVWDGVINVMDEMVAGLGEECLGLEDFFLVFSSGLENLQLGLIPPALDQVLAGSLERSRNPEVRVLFLLGANDGILPARLLGNGVLDMLEREELEKKGLALAPIGSAQLGDEQFFIYTALSRATERLYVCYSLTDPDGKGMAPSSVVRRLKSLFPLLKEEFWGNNVDSLQQVSHPGPLLQAYALHMGGVGQGQELSPLWGAIRQWLVRDPLRAPYVSLLEGASVVAVEGNLSKPLARRLYGRRLRVSVSRLEQFNRCPFAHFTRYGLRLQERSKYTLDSPDMGQFFHRLLHDFAVTLHDNGLDWGRLSKQESWQILSDLTDRVAPELQHEILLSNARYRYLTHKLKRTVHNAVKVLAEHARRGKFIPISLEIKFGDQGLPSIVLPLSEGDTLALVGQIDRVDAVYLEGEVFLRIFDYKSHPLTLSLDKVYYGLSLQLLTYLDVALQGAEVLLRNSADVLGVSPNILPGVQPAGFLYFPVIEPQLESASVLTPEELEERRLKAVKVDGYLLASDKVLEAMDRDLALGQSNLLNLRLTKEKKFRQGAKVLSVDQFGLLRTHLRQVLLETGERIMGGEISVKPFKMGKVSGCEYCVYKPVCHFEEGLPECVYRYLPSLEGEEIWHRISQIQNTPGEGKGGAGGGPDAMDC
ncbi:MAG: helicase-exonuclease AddAB subunit AddB [Desulfitobacteriaceae bacterium]